MRFLLVLLVLFSVPVLYSETEEQTVSRCIEDIRSGDLARRRRAAMVVGKYNTPEAVSAVVECLRDGDAVVRRSALVSLTEDRSMPAEARLPVIRLLKDDDVHIRRLASSVLPDCMGVRLRGRMSVSGNVRIRAGGGRTSEETEEMRNIINGALGDEDPSVRQNVLNAAFCYPFALDRGALEPFFKDSSPLMRILALRAYFSPESAGELSRAAMDLAADKSPEVRAEFAKSVVVLGASGGKIVLEMTGDADGNVAASAIETCAQLMLPEGPSLISSAFEDDRFNHDHKKRLCRLLRYYPDKAGPVLEKAVGMDGEIRDEALQLLLSGGESGEVLMKTVALGLASGRKNVRFMATAHIRRNVPSVTEDVLRKMLVSEYDDVRLALANMLRRFPAGNIRDELALDLFADEKLNVRIAAVRLLSALRPDGWEDIMLTALAEEQATDMREAVAVALCASSPAEKVAGALEKYRPSASGSVARRIDLYLKRARRLQQNGVK